MATEAATRRSALGLLVSDTGGHAATVNIDLRRERQAGPVPSSERIGSSRQHPAVLAGSQLAVASMQKSWAMPGSRLQSRNLQARRTSSSAATALLLLFGGRAKRKPCLRGSVGDKREVCISSGRPQSAARTVRQLWLLSTPQAVASRLPPRPSDGGHPSSRRVTLGRARIGATRPGLL